MSYFIMHGGYDEVYVRDDIECAVWLCRQFGIDVHANCEKIIRQVKKIKPGKTLVDENRGISITRLIY
jgi:hypothetical protein